MTAQLINAEDGYHLWSERYDRELTDVFAVQDEISAAIADALQVTLSAKRERSPHMPNLAAYEAYLRGLHLVKQNTADALRGVGSSSNRPSRLIRLRRAACRAGRILSPACHRGRASRAGRDAAARGMRRSARWPSIRRIWTLRPSSAVVAAVYDYDWNEVERIWGALGQPAGRAERGLSGNRLPGAQATYLGTRAVAPARTPARPLNGLFRVIRVILGRSGGCRIPLEALDEMRNVLNVNEDAWSRASAHFVIATGPCLRMEAACRGAGGGGTSLRGSTWHPRIIGMLAGTLAQAGQHTAPMT